MLIIRFNIFVAPLRILAGLKFGYSEYQKKMENVSNILAPMHKKLVKHLTVNIVIERISKILRKDVVVLVYNGQHLNK